jgi:hypothetical protein
MSSLQRFRRSPAQRVRRKEEEQRSEPSSAFWAEGGIRSLFRRQAGESPAALSAAGRPHLPAVRAERGFPFDAFPPRGNRD